MQIKLLQSCRWLWLLVFLGASPGLIFADPEPDLLMAYQVEGTISDADGTPLQGATVTVKSGTNGAITDENGKFSISVPDGAQTLVVYYFGYLRQEVSVSGKTTLNIALEVDATSLDEVIVVGYGTQKKVSLTGAVSTVSSEALTLVPVANASELLAGRVPGLLTKQTTGLPGNDATELRVRGFGTPLVLVDGIQMSMNRLDPNEIESISVLKDAAAAVYGARAGNGVILVTTKRGSNGKPTISYNGNVSWQAPTIVPQTVNSTQFAELITEGERNYGLEERYTSEEIELFRSGTDPNYPNQNWHDALFVDWAPMKTHNLSVRGGSDRVRYYVSAGYLDQTSLFTSTDWNFNRYNVRSNIDVSITDDLSLTMDVSYRHERRDEPNASISGTWTDLTTAEPVWPASLPDPSLGGPYSGFSQRTPLAQMTTALSGFRDDRRDYVTGRLGLTYDIPFIDGLSANATLNYFTWNRYQKLLNKPFDVLSYDYTTQDYTFQGSNGANTLSELMIRHRQLYPLIKLDYIKSFGNHNLNVLLLGEMIDTEELTFTAGRRDLLSTNIPYLFAGSPDNITNNGSAFQSGRASYVGRINYNFNEKYLIEAAFRYDASHKFPEATRWGFFPSISAGWWISEEDFLSGASWLDKLKMRASYTKSGDDNVTAFQYLAGYAIREGLLDVYQFGDQLNRVITNTGLPNTQITWLDMTIYNVALEGSVMDGLFGFEADFFYRLTENIFGTPQESYPSTFGATLPQLNINSTDDRGFDLILTHRKEIGDFRYNVAANIGFARRKYVSWSEDPYDDEDEIRIFQRTGNWVNRWIGYQADGLFMTQGEIDEHPVDQDQNGNTSLRPGDIKYIDRNADGVIDFRDQDVIGFGTFPETSYGLSLQAEYKGFSLSALFQGASRFNANITGGRRSPFSNWSVPFDYHYMYRWQPDPNDPGVNINPDVQLPHIDGTGTGSTANNNQTSDFWLQDNTYLRLKNINLAYSLPASVKEALNFQNIQIYVAGSNLLTFSKLGIYKKSWDPESGFTYPPVKTITLGLNVSL